MRSRSSPALALLCGSALVLGCAHGGPAPATTAPATTAAAASPGAGGPVALPPGEAVAFELRARGTQNYACREKPDAPGTWGWVLVAPEAELLDDRGNVVGRHYAGPTWESSQDGSKVAAKVVARADAPDADAIPWLLLQVTDASPTGTFADVKSVQRVETHGGKAPPSGCDPSAAEHEAKVPYTATYAFSRAKP